MLSACSSPWPDEGECGVHGHLLFGCRSTQPASLSISTRTIQVSHVQRSWNPRLRLRSFPIRALEQGFARANEPRARQ